MTPYEEFDWIPPDLAVLGVRRRTPATIPDLLTIWATPYPIITRYTLLCEDTGMEVFGGGTLEHPNKFHRPGAITSGYRDEIIEGNEHSAHPCATAMDIHVGPVEEQIRIGAAALKYFRRVGFYPDDEFIHVDPMPLAWIAKYNKAMAWVRAGGRYMYFSSFEKAADFARTVG